MRDGSGERGRMWVGDTLSSSQAVPGLGLVIAARCFVCVYISREAFRIVQKTVEEASLRAVL